MALIVPVLVTAPVKEDACTAMPAAADVALTVIEPLLLTLPLNAEIL